MVLLGGLTSEASHDIPPDSALTRWHQRNVGDGGRQHLLLDLKASESSRGRCCAALPPLTAVSRDAGFRTADGWRTPPSCPSARLRLLWPNDTSLKLWWSNPCQSDEESVRINALIWCWVVNYPRRINHNHSFAHCIAQRWSLFLLVNLQAFQQAFKEFNC